MEDKKMIAELFTRYVWYWNSHDMEKWGELFTDDTEFITWSGIKYNSNLENVRQHRKAHSMLSEQNQNMTYDLTIQNINLLREDIAAVHAVWSWKDFKTGNSPAQLRTGILTILLLKANGSWLIRYTHNTRTDKNLK